MIVRSPVLTEDYDGDWSLPVKGQLFPDLWLCHHVANRIWFMNSFSKIRMVVSDQPVEDAVRIRAWSGGGGSGRQTWDNAVVPDEGKVLLYSSFEDFLKKDFSPLIPVWVWIEEA